MKQNRAIISLLTLVLLFQYSLTETTTLPHHQHIKEEEELRSVYRRGRSRGNVGRIKRRPRCDPFYQFLYGCCGQWPFPTYPSPNNPFDLVFPPPFHYYPRPPPLVPSLPPPLIIPPPMPLINSPPPSPWWLSSPPPPPPWWYSSSPPPPPPWGYSNSTSPPPPPPDPIPWYIPAPPPPPPDPIPWYIPAPPPPLVPTP